MFDRYQLAWFVVFIGLLLLAMGASWCLHALFNYGYAFWYDYLDLREHIAQFGPQNRYILGFETLSPQAQIAAFKAIVHAVHGHALTMDASATTTLDALRHIQFTDAQGHSKALLREPEVVHLNDVAVLMQCLRSALLAIAPLVLMSLFLLRRRVGDIQWRWQAALLIIAWLLIALLIAWRGFEAVFYQLHIWIFPAGHEWFFYYQDSLMSTMMKAPDLFAGIGISLVAVGLMLFVMALILLRRFSARITR